MKRYIFAAALLSLCCFVGCSEPEVKAPDKDKVSLDVVKPASVSGGGGKGGGQSQSQSMRAEE